MGVVHEAIEGRVSQRRIADVFIPGRRRPLTGDDRGPRAIAIFQDLEEIATFLVLHRGEPPVIEHKDVDPRELGEQADVRPISPAQRELVKESRGAPVERAIAVATGLLGEGTREKALAHAGRADHKHILVLVDPAARRQLPHGASARGDREPIFDDYNALVVFYKQSNTEASAWRDIGRLLNFQNPVAALRSKVAA